MTWYYEHRDYYKHSFAILETRNARGETRFIASEKNDLGVIWFNLDSHSIKVKIEHDGSDSGRTPVYRFHRVRTNVQLKDLKKQSRDHTNYDLLTSNCHYYADWLLSSF